MGLRPSGISIVFVFWLSACGGGGDSGICRAIANSGSTGTATASLGATVNNGGAVFDGNLSSTASLEPAVTTLGGATLRGTLGAGTIDGGGYAGLALSGLNDSQTITVTVSTYLNGVLVESGSAGIQTGTSQACGGLCVSQGGDSFFGIPTSRVYDAIGASVELVGATQALQLRELCVR